MLHLFSAPRKQAKGSERKNRIVTAGIDANAALTRSKESLVETLSRVKPPGVELTEFRSRR